MSQDIKDKWNNQPGCGQFILHELIEADFPYLLLWMNRESYQSLELLTRLSRDSQGLRFITGVNSERARVSSLTLQKAGFGALETSYVLKKGECCITQLQKSKLVNQMSDLMELMHCYIHHVTLYLKPQKIYWEVHQIDGELLRLAALTGFRKSSITTRGSHLLHEYVGNMHDR